MLNDSHLNAIKSTIQSTLKPLSLDSYSSFISILALYIYVLKRQEKDKDIIKIIECFNQVANIIMPLEFKDMISIDFNEEDNYVIDLRKEKGDNNDCNRTH